MNILYIFFLLYSSVSFGCFAKLDVPLAPTNVRVECSNWTATVFFVYEDSSEFALPLPYEFHIQYNENPDEPSSWQNSPHPVKVLKNNEAFANLQLHSYATFAFRVVARNQFGDSAPAYSVDNACTTGATEPRSNPINVHTSHLSSNSLYICWRPMPFGEWCGPGFYYIVEYDLSDDSHEQSHTINVTDPSVNCLTINDQPTYRPYNIRVWAANSIGRASIKPTTVRGFSGEGDPTGTPSEFGLASNNTLRGNVATFKWKPVHESNVRGRLQRYIIKHWSEDDQQQKEVSFGPQATQGTIHSLKSDRKNFALIMIENSSGKLSQSSNTISFSMQKGPPSEITCLEAIAYPTGVIKVSWKAPSYFNDAPLGYEIRWCMCNRQGADTKIRPKENSDCIVGPILEANETEYTILDPRSHTDYVIKVAALSSSGRGKSSSIRAVVGPTPNLEGSSSIKPEFRSTLAHRYEANITWKLVDTALDKSYTIADKLINITAFVKYKKRESTPWRTLQIPKDQLWVSLTGLCPGTSYDAMITHTMESEFNLTRIDFLANFHTAEPKDEQCVEKGLRIR